MKDDNTNLIDVITSINKHSCPNQINFHCHTTFSDGSLSPIELITQAIDLQIEHISITDHHSINGYLIANKWLISES